VRPRDRDIVRLAVPAFGALIAEPLYILADTAVVGHLGTPQLGGLAVASSVLLTGYAVFIFLAYGTTGTVARLIGAGNEREAAHQAVQGMWLALCIAGVLVPAGLLSGEAGWFEPSAQQGRSRPTRRSTYASACSASPPCW
jgi:Na+-driven multidrug efflux pump